MPDVEWNDSLAIGVDIVDKQHKELFRIVSSFGERIDKEEPSFTLDAVLDSLKNYVHYHFATEQRLLARNACPDLVRHQGAHAAFSAMIARYEDRRATIDRQGLLALQAYLLDWLKSHVEKEDLPLRQYLVP